MTDAFEGLAVRASAKINLHLGVGSPRADGFHPLDTVYQAITLYDDVIAAAGDTWSLDLDAAHHIAAADVPLSDANIVAKAAQLLADHHRRDRAALVRIHKDIPVAGGLAGGSADAAAALVALDRLWGCETSDDTLLALAAELGSDVPFALLGGTGHGTGRGEIVHAVPDEGPWWWVVVPDRSGLSTPAVYRHFDQLRPDADPEPTPSLPVLQALATGDAAELADALHNDLQPAALDLRPDLADVIARGEEAGALRGHLTGSGPTVVFLCSDAPHARAVAGDLGAHHDVVLVATGPAPGAHVVL